MKFDIIIPIITNADYEQQLFELKKIKINKMGFLCNRSDSDAR